jgi:hypothetical protein
VDNILPHTFVTPNGLSKRSALSCLLREVSIGLDTHLILSGTGLGIESAITTLSSSVGVANMAAQLFGVTSFLGPEEVGAALAARGITTLPDENVLHRFSGRPRFTMNLAGGLIRGVDPDTVVREIVKGGGGIKGLEEQLRRLYTVPVGSREADKKSAKSVYGELRAAATSWVLKGLGGVSRGGEVALEAGVCSLDVRASSDGSASTFVIKEAIVVQTFTDLPTVDFEGLSNENAAQIGLMFEDYIAWNAQALCSMLHPERVSLVFSRLGPDYVGQWEVTPPAGDERRGSIALRDGDEPRLIRAILDRNSARGQSLVFPLTKMGPDVIVVARRPDGRWLLMFVQAKASMSASTPQAMKSLQFPYHVNRDKKPKLPDNEDIRSAAGELDEIMARNDVTVVLLVIKFPANSKGFKRAQLAQMELANGGGPKKPKTKKVLELVVDGSNARSWLASMEAGLSGMDSVKRARTDVFREG